MATSACSVGAWQHAWLVRASRPCPCSNVDRASLCARVGYRWRRPRRGCWRLISDEAVLLCVRRVLDAALGASSRRCTHAAEPNPRRAPAAPAHEPRRAFISPASPKGGLSCQAGLASALQRPHGQQRTASIAGRWGRC